MRLLAVQGRTLHVQGLDVLDRTPLLDIKPFAPEPDAPHADRIGWLADKARRVLKA